jgi:3-isopropylmalate/(R)-2-methylmalate dehydratase small subunit
MSDAATQNLVRTGRVWNFGDNVSTDLIMPGAILWNHVTTPEARKGAIMPQRPGWAAGEVRPGDLIFAGKNFGCGSSRPAPRILARDLGLSCVVAESFSRLFQRNAVNIGFPVLICPGIASFAQEGDFVEVHFDTGKVRNVTRERR